jgi:hypothetical protein
MPPDVSLTWPTATQNALAAVGFFAPRIRTAVRLPQYTKPDVAWHLLSTCDPAFAALLRRTWDQFDLRNPAHMDPTAALLFRYHRMHGLDKLYRLGKIVCEPDCEEGGDCYGHAARLQLRLALQVLLEDALFRLLTPLEQRQWFPCHSFAVAVDEGAHGRGLLLFGASLAVATSTHGQPFYYAPTRPTVLVQGQGRRPVAFTPHAITRMHERLYPADRRDAHRPLTCTFGLVAYPYPYEGVELYGGQPGLAMFAPGHPEAFSGHYVEQIVGPVADVTAYRYRFGYCPLTQEGDFWVAKTLLPPGFRGTPEYGRLLRTSLAPGVKERLLAACEALTVASLVEGAHDFTLLRWFHRHGHPQVVPVSPTTARRSA